MKQRVFVTGSTGFIGSHLSERLRLAGHAVISFKGDLLDLAAAKKSLYQAKPSVVYHLGALVDLSRNYDTALSCIDINIKGTLNLLEALRGSTIKRFIYTSTEEVYGDNKLPYREHQLPNPPSPYAVSKIAAEQLIKLYAYELGFTALLFRIGTAYGPHQPLNRLIPQIILKALQNEDIPLNSGKKKRDYIFIDDVIDALCLALDTSIPHAVEILNLGGGKQYSLRDLVQKILSFSKSESRPQFGAFPDRIFEADEWFLDSSKAKRILKWRPKTSLRVGLGKMIAHYKEKSRE